MEQECAFGILESTARQSPPTSRMDVVCRWSGDGSWSAPGPGSFVNIALDGLYLRRPISVCDWDDGESDPDL